MSHSAPCPMLPLTGGSVWVGLYASVSSPCCPLSNMRFFASHFHGLMYKYNVIHKTGRTKYIATLPEESHRLWSCDLMGSYGTIQISLLLLLLLLALSIGKCIHKQRQRPLLDVLVSDRRPPSFRTWRNQYIAARALLRTTTQWRHSWQHATLSIGLHEPLCANMTSSTRPEVHNVTICRQGMAKPRPYM